MKAKKTDLNIQLCLLISSLLVILFARICGATDYNAIGESSAHQALQSYGSKSGLNENLAKPLTSNTPMTTLDRSKSFSARLVCPSTQVFLKVSYIPIDSFSNLQVIVKEDLDLNGNFEYIYSFPVKVSGICPFGIVSCEQGWGTSCNIYPFVVDSSGKLTLGNKKAYNAQSGCYCINKSCSTVSPVKILEDLGGGIAASISSANPRFAIAKVDIKPESLEINFSGQAVRDCTTVGATGGVTTPESLYQAGNFSVEMTASGPSVNAYMPSGTGELRDWYSTLSQTRYMQDNPVNHITCSITNTVTKGACTQEEIANGSGSGSICTDHYLYARVYKANDYEYHLQLLDTGMSGNAHHNCGGGGGGIGNWHTLEVIHTTEPVADIVACFNAWGGGCSSTSGTCIYNFNQQTHLITCPAKGAQYPSYEYYYALYTRHCSATNRGYSSLADCNSSCFAMTHTDGCSNIDQSKCTLNDEIVWYKDGYTANLTTGVSYPNCPANVTCKWQGELFSGSKVGTISKKDKITVVSPSGNYCWRPSNEYTVCMNGSVATAQSDGYSAVTVASNSDMRPRIDRRYVCREQNNTPNLSRAQGIINSSRDSGTQITMNDSLYGSQNIDVRSIARKNYDCYPKVCKVSYIEETQQSTVQAKLKERGKVFELRNCNGDVCPVSATETILKNCACPDEFAESITHMAGLMEATKDMICSSQ